MSEDALPAGGDMNSPLSWKIPPAAGPLSPCNTTMKPVCLEIQASTVREATTMEARVLPILESSPSSPQLEKAPAQQQDSAQSKTNK